MGKGGKRAGAGRPKQSMADRPKVKDGGSVAMSFKDGDATYECRYVRCGRGCSRCNPQFEGFDEAQPGHGPYWYRLVPMANGRTKRFYIGRSLRKGLEEKAKGAVAPAAAPVEV